MRHLFRMTLVGASLSLCALPAAAQWYVGGSVGESRAKMGGASQADALLDLGFDDAATRFDDKDTMYRLHGGFRFNRWFALEGGYVDLGKFEVRSSVLPAGTLDTSIKAHGFDLSAVGLLPIGDRFTLFARAGAFSSEVKASYSGTGSVVLFEGQQEQKKRKTHAAYGAGVMYDFTPHLSLRAEYARYDRLGDDLTGGRFDVDAISAGVQWRF